MNPRSTNPKTKYKTNEIDQNTQELVKFWKTKSYDLKITSSTSVNPTFNMFSITNFIGKIKKTMNVVDSLICLHHFINKPFFEFQRLIKFAIPKTQKRI